MVHTEREPLVGARLRAGRGRSRKQCSMPFTEKRSHMNRSRSYKALLLTFFPLVLGIWLFP